MTKWTEERTAQLHELAGSKDTEVSRETVENIASEMDASTRSISTKLRREGFEVQKVSATPSAFTEEEAEELRSLIENNPGEYTYAQLAEQLGSDHSAKAVQGKVLSMELYSQVAPTPKKEAEKLYTDEETETVLRMAQEGAYLEEIAEAVGKEVNSVRGKALSLLRAGDIETLPAQRDKKAAKDDIFDGLEVSEMTVEEIMEATGKTARGIRTTLTRRKLSAKDYDGAAKAEKNASKA